MKGDNYQPPPTPPPPTVECAPGWDSFQSRCYFFSPTKANSWQEAANSCKNENFIASLVSITSKGELEYILCKIKK